MQKIPFEKSFGAKRVDQPIAVCLELPEYLTDEQAIALIEKMKEVALKEYKIQVVQLWVNRYAPTLGSSPVFYCP